MDIILKTKIITIHNTIYRGILINGNSFIVTININIKSAIESNFEPMTVIEFVFLAIYPSKTSLKQQITYTMKNKDESGFI